MESLPKLVEILRDAGFLGGAAVFIWSLARGHLIWGSDHRKIVSEKDKQLTEYKGIVDRVHHETAERLRRLEEDLERGRPR